mmetsp:Transcript_34481/g.41605  ORF Transcript_34481/g.41605 Transcript_34481/m.41605 type:complete len:101 (-) Transcript_34481:604-906(-)
MYAQKSCSFPQNRTTVEGNKYDIPAWEQALTGRVRKKRVRYPFGTTEKQPGTQHPKLFVSNPPPPAAQNNKAYKTRTITVPIMQNAPPDIFPIHKKKVSV